MLKKFFQMMLSNILCLGVIGCSNQPSSSIESKLEFNLVDDVRSFCKVVPEQYAYFDARAHYWEETCKRAEKEATLLKSKSGSLEVLERMIDDLYDPHISLNTNNQKSPRLIPSGSDIWVDRIGGNYVVAAVRPLSGAAKAGVAVGDQLLNFNGMKPLELASTRIHSGDTEPNEQRMTWAINAAIAGNRIDPRNLIVRRGDDKLSFEMDFPEVSHPDNTISYETLSERVGYIRFNDSLGNSASISAFNEALNALRETKGLIIDLRQTPGGGNTDVAEPILGRFIEEERAYQRTVFRSGFSKNRKVKPTGAWTYKSPVIVLVGRWTGSMGEGMAIGFDGMERGQVIGSKMAGLAGGTESIKLKETGLTLSLPTYDLHHINGTPRHYWETSEIFVADNGNEEDLLLKRAIRTLQ